MNESKLGYEGHQYDDETRLTYARARYLDNRYGVLLSGDVVEGVGTELKLETKRRALQDLDIDRAQV